MQIRQINQDIQRYIILLVDEREQWVRRKDDVEDESADDVRSLLATADPIQAQPPRTP